MNTYGGNIPGQQLLEKGKDLVTDNIGNLQGNSMVNELIKNLLKYLIQGLAVAIAAHYIPKSNIKMSEVLMIALTSASTFAILEMYAPPGMHMGSMLGTGFTIGQNLVNV